MNLRAELMALDSDSLQVALSNLTTPELMGLAKPIANTPTKWLGPATLDMYCAICKELERRPRWDEYEHELRRLEGRVRRIEAYLPPL